MEWFLFSREQQVLLVCPGDFVDEARISRHDSAIHSIND